MKTLRFSILMFFCFVVFLSFLHVQHAEAQQKYTGEILIQVNPRIIALPEGEVAKVPINAARFRSTELRDLNEQYKAVSIEKLYELKEDKKGMNIESQDILKSEQKDKKKDKATVDLSRIFTKKVKKEFREKGKEVKQVSDSYLLQFESEEELFMSGIVSAYRALDVVIHAEQITRSR